MSFKNVFVNKEELGKTLAFVAKIRKKDKRFEIKIFLVKLQNNSMLSLYFAYIAVIAAITTDITVFVINCLIAKSIEWLDI